MKHISWALALPLGLAWAGEARAQYLPYYNYGGGYSQSGGLGFSYQRRGLNLFGFLGGGSASRTFVVDPYWPPVYGPPGLGPYPPPVVLRPVVVLPQGAPRRGSRPMTLAEET